MFLKMLFHKTCLALFLLRFLDSKIVLSLVWFGFGIFGKSSDNLFISFELFWLTVSSFLVFYFWLLFFEL